MEQLTPGSASMALFMILLITLIYPGNEWDKMIVADFIKYLHCANL
jgi:hypothetical protein